MGIKCYEKNFKVSINAGFYVLNKNIFKFIKSKNSVFEKDVLSKVAKSKGIFAASSFLRHKSTAVTQQHYVAPAPESPNFGKFLK